MVAVVAAGAAFAAVIAVLLGVLNGGGGGVGAAGPHITLLPDAPALVPTPADSTSGSSDVTLRFFAAAPGWRLAYTFICPADMSGFFVDAADQPSYTNLINAAGTSGSGTAPGTDAIGPIDLEISTPCRWTLALRPQAGG